MPPRRSNGSTSAKRERSPSSSLSPAPPTQARTVKKVPRPSGADIEVDVPQPSTDTPQGTPKPKKPRKTARSAITKIEPDEEPALPDATPGTSSNKVEKVKKTPRPPKIKVGSDDKPEPPTNGDDPSPPAKKHRVPKAKPWPPPQLAPDRHPPRNGYPVFPLPALSVPPNGGIASSSSTPRPHLVGAHVSIGGGVGGALLRAGMAGANALAMFTKSQRQWKSNPIEGEAIERFRGLMKGKEDGGIDLGAECILVHGSYLINLANPDQAKWDVSYECFRDDISRCHQLGIKLYNWHPGSTTGVCTKEEGYATIAKAINRVHGDVPEVICVIENMANANSNIIGTTFHDLSSIISLVKDKSRVRICLDTCHLFAAGYDIRTPTSYADVMRSFNEEVGNGFLGGVHMNDSKADLGACKDLHENIGLGKIGLSAFRAMMRDPLMSGIPLILETPAPEKALELSDLAIWAREIKLLYEIQGIGDDEWVVKEGEIERRWREVRDLLNPPKPPKEKKVKEKEKGGGEVKAKAKKGKKTEEEEEEEEESGESRDEE